MLDQFFDGIPLIFKRSCNGQALAMLEEGKNLASPSGGTGGINQTQRAPSMNWRARQRFTTLIGRRLDARLAATTLHTLLRRKEEVMMRVLIRQHLQFAQIKARMQQSIPRTVRHQNRWCGIPQHTLHPTHHRLRERLKIAPLQLNERHRDLSARERQNLAQRLRGNQFALVLFSAFPKRNLHSVTHSFRRRDFENSAQPKRKARDKRRHFRRQSTSIPFPHINLSQRLTHQRPPHATFPLASRVQDLTFHCLQAEQGFYIRAARH